MFNYIANNLSLNLKNIVCIKKEIFSNFLTMICIKFHNYNLDTNEKNIKICSLSLFSNKIYLSAFVQLTYDINEISCKIFIVLLAHQAST